MTGSDNVFVCFPAFNSAGSHSVPNILVAETSTQTLTNKSLTSPELTGTITVKNDTNNIGFIDFYGSASNYIRLQSQSLTGDVTLTLPDNTGDLVSTGDTGTVTPTMF